MIQVCLNGRRAAADHPALSADPGWLADEARLAVAAGAGAVHVHPRDAHGQDSVDPDDVAAVVTAVRAAVGDVEVGVTTGAWAGGDVDQRRAAVAAWQVLPDVASVNWHEDGAAELADLLLSRGVGVEAGLWTINAAHAWKSWAPAERTHRVLLEIGEGSEAFDPESEADALLREIGDAPSVPVLLHGNGPSAWPLVRYARMLSLDVRIGLEDVLSLPDGSPAPADHPNAALVAAALDLD